MFDQLEQSAGSAAHDDLLCARFPELGTASAGRSDYPADLPLREVVIIARHCSGGVILGFNQFTATAGVVKPGTKKEIVLTGSAKTPSAWNNLEAGILYALRKPLLVFREVGITGGVFDPGVTDVFVHDMPGPKSNAGDLREVFLKWRDRVGAAYYALA